MSDAIFPRLPGLTWEIKPIPTWSTVVQKSKNRARTALQNDPYPLWTFELTYEFLRDSKPIGGPTVMNPAGYSELEQLAGFYNSRGGSFDDFLLDPALITGRPRDSEVHGAVIGVGDGATTTFYLQRDAGGFMDEVQDPVGEPFIADNGVPQTSGWTLGDGGLITFAAPPAATHVITADFRWRWRVCFSEDTLDVNAFMFELYECQSVKLEQVKR